MTSGGLVSYDADRTDIFRRTASYVDRVLHGEKPGDLPFQQPLKYQLTIKRIRAGCGRSAERATGYDALGLH